VFITEGEMDACALVEAGIPQNQVLSVPTGAVERPADKPMDERGYGYAIDALKAGLSGSSGSSGAATTTGRADRCAPTWRRFWAWRGSGLSSGRKAARTPTMF
jgi:hypothetical protein